MTVNSEDCGYVLYSYCTCEKSPYASERCSYEFVDECPLHNEEV